MDAAELDRRFRRRGKWLSAELARLLVECGHLDELRLQARDGDWFCVLEVARGLIADDRWDEALGVLSPFVDSGWGEAVRTVAALLDEADRTDEAIALLSRGAGTGDRLTLQRLAVLLAREGRAEETFQLLRPHVGDWYLAQAMVDLSGAWGRDEEITALLRAEVGDDLSQADVLLLVGLARMLERQGHVEQALDVLVSHEHGVNVNGRDQVADLLLRHGLKDRLRDHVVRTQDEYAANSLVELLEAEGDVDEAAEVLRTFAASGSPNAAVRLANLLAAHGRLEEAIEVLRPVPGAMDGDPEWVVYEFSKLVIEHGRPEEALALIDDLGGHEPWAELFFERVRVLSRIGRVDQAIVELRAHPDVDSWYVGMRLAELLAGAGQLDEAIEVMWSKRSHLMGVLLLAELLIRRGRVKDAVAAVHEWSPSNSPLQGHAGSG